MDSPFRCSLLVALLLVLLVAGLVCEARTKYSILDFDLARKHELWMAEHGRVYKDEAEKARRFEIFKENVKYIEEFNKAGGQSYRLGINHFADLTTEEFAGMYLGAIKPPTEWELGEDDETVIPDILDLVPTSVDWRDQGAVTPVQLQGKCESCWAFSTVAAIEGLNKIKNGILYELSEQQIVDCGSGFTNGCEPSYPHKAMDYIVKNGGLTTRSNYPYTAKNVTCDKMKEKDTEVSITGRTFLPRQDELFLAGFVAKQPVVVLIDANKTEFQLYDNGVYKGPCGGAMDTNHAVTIVGYGEDGPNDKYWTIKNSWSEKWGESGYVRLHKDAGVKDGVCGVAAWPLIPTM